MARSKRETIILSGEERERLERIRDHPSSLRRHAWRADIVLHLGSGSGLMDTVRGTGRSKPCVWRWWDRFLAERVDGLLYDATRPPGRKRTAESGERELVELAMSSPPHASHRPLRELAGRIGGMAHGTVRNILRAKGLRPHRVKTFRVSRDPAFERRIHDVEGLYVNPPDHAVVLSVDGKRRIQALGRTRRPLPMKRGHATTRTHDYRRNGTACLMAAPAIATGKVIGQMVERHRSREFLAFLDHVAEGIAPGTEVHVILDNVPSHRSAKVHKWLKANPDWTFHFTPTSASWANAVEGIFPKPGRQRLKHAVFDSPDECIAAIGDYLDHHNEHQARPFRWSSRPDDLVTSCRRGYQMIYSDH